VKRKYRIKHVPLTVIPYYDDFEELQESETKTKTAYYSGEYHVDPTAMYYVMNEEEIKKTFDFNTMKFDEESSQLYFTKQIDNPKDVTEFLSKLEEYLHSFVKEVVQIPQSIFVKVQEEIKAKRDEFAAEEVDFRFEDFGVVLVGKRNDVVHKKSEIIKAMLDRITQEALKESINFLINDKSNLKFLNFIDYVETLMRAFPEVQIHGTDGISGNLTLSGTADNIKEVQLRMVQDLMKISEIDVKMSDRQIDFLLRTNCDIVNNELRKDDVMLLLVPIKDLVGTKAWEAKIFSLTKCDDDEVAIIVCHILS
jgi:hypothetical protein